MPPKPRNESSSDRPRGRSIYNVFFSPGNDQQQQHEGPAAPIVTPLEHVLDEQQQRQQQEQEQRARSAALTRAHLAAINDILTRNSHTTPTTAATATAATRATGNCNNNNMIQVDALNESDDDNRHHRRSHSLPNRNGPGSRKVRSKSAGRVRNSNYAARNNNHPSPLSRLQSPPSRENVSSPWDQASTTGGRYNTSVTTPSALRQTPPARPLQQRQQSDVATNSFNESSTINTDAATAHMSTATASDNSNKNNKDPSQQQQQQQQQHSYFFSSFPHQNQKSQSHQRFDFFHVHPHDNNNNNAAAAEEEEEAEDDFLKRFYETTVDGTCQIPCHFSMEEQMDILTHCRNPLAFLSFFNAARHPSDPAANENGTTGGVVVSMCVNPDDHEPPPMPGAYVLPTFCEYCQASSTAKCLPHCTRPKLYFQKKRPPFCKRNPVLWDADTDHAKPLLLLRGGDGDTSSNYSIPIASPKAADATTNGTASATGRDPTTTTKSSSTGKSSSTTTKHYYSRQHYILSSNNSVATASTVPSSTFVSSTTTTIAAARTATTSAAVQSSDHADATSSSSATSRRAAESFASAVRNHHSSLLSMFATSAE